MSESSGGQWLVKLQRLVGGMSVFEPDSITLRHPAPGYWAVMGPTGEYDLSAKSSDHAAMLYLAHYCGDMEAEVAMAAENSEKTRGEE